MIGNKEGWDIPGPFYLSMGTKYIYCVCIFDLVVLSGMRDVLIKRYSM